MSPAYEAALLESLAASKAFGQAQAAYRARHIGDEAFLAARAKWLAAEVVFDAAYAAEQDSR